MREVSYRLICWALALDLAAPVSDVTSTIYHSTMVTSNLYKILCVMVMVILVGGDPEQLVVETTAGFIKGERKKSDLGKDIDIWASIPYAEPPVGSLR